MKKARRKFISFGLAAGAGLALAGLGALWPERPFVRPPRALPGGDFAARCLRCGACVQVCPTRALALLDLEADFRHVGVPWLEARRGGCTAWQDGCRLCAAACPSGALDPAMPLTVVGVASFPEKLCTNCMLCLRRCPVPGAVYFPNPEGGPPWSKEQEKQIPAPLRSVHSSIKPVIDQSLCVGCGLCAAVCAPKIIRLFPPSSVKWGL
ncbi:MAG: 4Fe-4S binding protein [Deltaproteobacteria bacterium]|jgi:ferredoxin-type protein NapG|nr:4Fe-4S binding protein [Deltaproteobacteria bacterium]